MGIRNYTNDHILGLSKNILHNANLLPPLGVYAYNIRSHLQMMWPMAIDYFSKNQSNAPRVQFIITEKEVGRVLCRACQQQCTALYVACTPSDTFKFHPACMRFVLDMHHKI